VSRKRTASVSLECEEVERESPSIPGEEEGEGEEGAWGGAAERIARLSARLHQREEDHRLLTDRLQVPPTHLFNT